MAAFAETSNVLYLALQLGAMMLGMGSAFAGYSLLRTFLVVTSILVGPLMAFVLVNDPQNPVASVQLNALIPIIYIVCSVVCSIVCLALTMFAVKAALAILGFAAGFSWQVFWEKYLTTRLIKEVLVPALVPDEWNVYVGNFLVVLLRAISAVSVCILVITHERVMLKGITAVWGSIMTVCVADVMFCAGNFWTVLTNHTQALVILARDGELLYHVMLGSTTLLLAILGYIVQTLSESGRRKRNQKRIRDANGRERPIKMTPIAIRV